MLRHQESSALVQGAGDQISIHRPYSEKSQQGRIQQREGRRRLHGGTYRREFKGV